MKEKRSRRTAGQKIKDEERAKARWKPDGAGGNDNDDHRQKWQAQRPARDTLAQVGMAGMTVGAMVSTLREKGLLRVMLGEAENMNGRTRREKYIELTETGKKVAEALGVE